MTEETQPVEATSFDEAVTQALERYSPTDAAIGQLAADYGELDVEGIDDKKGLALVHTARIDVRDKRVGVEKTRKALKKDALEFGRRVDAEAKRLTGLLTPIETRLHRIEKAVENEKQRIREEEERAERARQQARLDKLAALGDSTPAIEVLAMDEEAFGVRLANAQHAYDRRKAREEEERLAHEKAEAERKAKEAAERKELEEELAREREERRKAEEAAALAKAREQQEREAAEAQLAKEREELRAERERVAAEKRQVEIAQAKERAAQEERERIARQERAEAEHKRELERLAPQREKIQVFVERLRALPIPVVDVEDEILAIVESAAKEIEELLGG